VVDHLDPKDFPGPLHFAADGDVLHRGHRVSGRMVVGKKDRMGFVRDRGAESLTGMIKTLVESPSGNFLDSKNPSFRIQQDRQQHLDGEETHPRSQKLDRILRRRDLPSQEIFLSRAGTQREGGDQASGFGWSDALALGELSQRSPSQCLQAAEPRDELLSQPDGRKAAPTDSEKNRQQLRILQPIRAVRRHPLQRSFRRKHLANPPSHARGG